MNEHVKVYHVGLGGYTILQAPSVTNIQMMSFVIRTPGGHTVVMDGGFGRDATEYLCPLLAQYGNHVDLWLLTHCHSDHYSALLEIFKNGLAGLEIDRILVNFPPHAWVNRIETDSGDAVPNAEMYAVMAKNAALFQTVHTGDVFTVDGLRIDVLCDPAEYLDFEQKGKIPNAGVNGTSVVYKLTFPNGKTALFLGDLDLFGGNLLAGRYGEKLKSDIVQMAHHGQNGCGENVYRLVKPELCLWPAPMWLYNNDAGKGYNTHVWKTVTVRGWMDALGVKKHAVEGEGPALVE